MSGGSFDYFYTRGVEDILGRREQIKEMADRVKGQVGLGDNGIDEVVAEAIYKMLMKYYHCLDQSYDIIESWHSYLNELLHDIEWAASADYGWKTVEETFNKMMEAKPNE